MATLDDSPSLYLGQQWTHWAEKVEGKSKNDHPSSKEECCSKDDGDTIKLRHQDMPLYGLCPARDEFYLVVCECCEQVVKPQALKRHIEQRHGHSSPRLSGVRKSKGSPGRHSGSPGRHGGSPARHTGSPGRHTSPKRDSHGKTPPINPPGMKNPSKSSSSSSHRSSTSNAKSSKKQSNHAMPVVKVERMQPSVLAAKSSSSSSTKISSTKISSTKVSSTKHDHSDKEHKHEKEHREHHKDHRDHSKEHKHEKDHKDHKEKEHREHHKDHREHNRDHKEKDHKHDKEHKDYKEKEHTREKEHKEHSKDREHKEKDHGLEKDHKQDRDRDHSKEKDHRDKDYSRDRDHKDKHDRDRERDRDKDRNRERDKERGKDREKDRDKDRERDREKEREKDRDKEREKDRDKEREKDREKDSEKERDHKEKDHHHKDHREKKSLSNQNQSSSGSTSQTTSSVTPPRPSSSQKTSVSTPSPSTKLNASDLTSPSVGTSKPKFVKEKMLPCKDREFDANKHCGVWAPEDGRQCTRSLTCKTHALSLRRAVQGRRKPFDELLKEHRAAKEAFLKAKAEEKEAAAAAKAAGTTSLSTASSAKQSSSSSNSRESSKDTSTTASAAAKAAACNAMPVAKPSKVQLKVTSPTPSRPAPPPPPPPREEAPTNDRLSSDAEDDDDDRDRLGFPMLSFHPRPAAMNSFGARCYSGSSCIVFNRRADLLRAAFHACVERHLHPPPHKKLCVESKLPQGSNITTNTQDPYDFPAMESNPLATNGFPSGLISPTSSHNSLTSSWNSSKQSNKVKPKSSLSLSSASASLSSPVSRNIRPKDVPSSKGAAITSPVAMVIGGGMAASLSSITPITPVTSLTRTGTVPASSMVNSTGVKRKRSGSGTVVGGLTTHTLPAGLTVNHHGTSAGNPISIAIPSGSLNLANLTQAQLNSINETISKVNAGGQHLLTSGQQVLTGANSGAKNHLLKDVNIMVTSRDPGVMNGQLVTTTAMPTSAIADIAHLQLNSLSGETNTLPQTHKPKKEKRLKLSHSSSTGHDGVNATMSTLTSLPGGVMVMPDLTGQQTFTQAFGSTGLLTTSTDFTSSKLSPSTTSPLFASGSASPQTSTGSPLPNGMLGPGLELKVKGLPVNHVAGAMMVSPGSASSTPSPSTASADSLGLSLAQQQSLQHRSKAMRLGSVSSRKSSGSRSKSHSKTQQLAPQVAASQQLTAAAITLTSPGNRLLSTTTLPMYTMDASSGQFQHIQIQPKATGKQTLATGKLSMQPMSLTIPMAGVSVTSPQQQAHATLLLQNDDHQRELSGAHHAAAAQQLQNSPSNVLS